MKASIVLLLAVMSLMSACSSRETFSRGDTYTDRRHPVGHPASSGWGVNAGAKMHRPPEQNTSMMLSPRYRST